MERTRRAIERDNFMGKKMVSHAYGRVCDDLILVSIYLYAYHYLQSFTLSETNVDVSADSGI